VENHKKKKREGNSAKPLLTAFFIRLQVATDEIVLHLFTPTKSFDNESHRSGQNHLK
jgi:hypothetical protein